MNRRTGNEPAGDLPRTWPLILAGGLVALPASAAMVAGLAMVNADSDSVNEPSDDGLSGITALAVPALIVGAAGIVLGVGCIFRNRVSRVLTIIAGGLLAMMFVREAVFDWNHWFLLPAVYPAGVSLLALTGRPARSSANAAAQ